MIYRMCKSIWLKRLLRLTTTSRDLEAYYILLPSDEASVMVMKN